MKNLKLNLILILFFFSLKLMAQPNPFFPMENAVWEGESIGFGGPTLPFYTVTCGDTLINNETYVKLYILRLDSMGNIISKEYKGASKTGADQVMYIPRLSQTPQLLYDFSLETGQSIDLETPFGTFTLTVAGNSLMTDNAGISRRVITFEPNPTVEIWIEGIGSNRGVLDRGRPQMIDFETYMNCFKYEDILIWSNESNMPECSFSYTEMSGTTSIQDFSKYEKVELSFSPNPMLEETVVQISDLDLLESSEIRVYNFQGQLIQKIMELNEEKFSFFRKDLNAGMYVFELFDTKTTFALRKKLVIF